MLLGRDRRREGIAGIRIKDHRGAQEVTPDIFFFIWTVCVCVCYKSEHSCCISNSNWPSHCNGEKKLDCGVSRVSKERNLQVFTSASGKKETTRVGCKRQQDDTRPYEACSTLCLH